MAIRAPASWAIRAISSTGCQAPVEVSAWTIPTTLGPTRLTAASTSSRVEDLAVRPLDRRDLGPGPLGDVDHPAAEDAVDADEHPVARLDQVDDDRLHPGRAGPRDRQRQPVLGLEDVAEQVLRLVHQGHELGVEVAEQRHPQRGQDARMDVARARAQEQPRRTGSAGPGSAGVGMADTARLLESWSASDRPADGRRRSARPRPIATSLISSLIALNSGRSERLGPLEQDGLGGRDDGPGVFQPAEGELPVDLVPGGHGVGRDLDAEAQVEQFEGRLGDADVGLDPGERHVADVAGRRAARGAGGPRSSGRSSWRAGRGSARRSRRPSGPGPCGYCSVAQTGIPRARAPRIRADRVGDHRLAVRDQRQELLLEVHDQQPAMLRGQSLGRTHRDVSPPVRETSSRWSADRSATARSGGLRLLAMLRTRFRTVKRAAGRSDAPAVARIRPPACEPECRSPGGERCERDLPRLVRGVRYRIEP